MFLAAETAFSKQNGTWNSNTNQRNSVVAGRWLEHGKGSETCPETCPESFPAPVATAAPWCKEQSSNTTYLIFLPMFHTLYLKFLKQVWLFFFQFLCDSFCVQLFLFLLHSFFFSLNLIFCSSFSIFCSNMLYN